MNKLYNVQGVPKNATQVMACKLEFFEECLPKFWCIFELQKWSYECSNYVNNAKTVFLWLRGHFLKLKPWFFYKNLWPLQMTYPNFIKKTPNTSQVTSHYCCGAFLAHPVWLLIFSIVDFCQSSQTQGNILSERLLSINI